MKDDQFRIVSGKRRQVSHDVNEERLKQMKTHKPSLLDRFLSLFQSKKK
ncbi:hypothetical protein K8I31_22780 [bacterium]|nr:hypothetical protein [bacterium]